MIKRPIASFLLIPCSLALVSAALAQASDPDSVTAGGMLKEVVVTAQRRAEPLQTVPVAVTAISQKQLEQAGIEDMSRLAAMTPGLFVGEAGADSEPAMRGVHTVNSREAQADAAIAFFVDGVYQSSNQEAFAPYVDVARVEVDRGPQGTLYGRNSFGGNIGVITNLPTPHFSASVSALGGNFGERRFEGVLNVPISSSLQLRGVALADNSSGYVHNIGPGGNLAANDTRYFRVSALWTPTEKLKAILRANYWEAGGHGDTSVEYKVLGTLVNPAQPYNPDGSLNEDVHGVPIYLNPRVTSGSGIPALAGYPAGVPVVPGPWTIDTNVPGHQSLAQHAATLELDYDLDFATLKSISAYNRFNVTRTGDSDFTPYNVEYASQGSPNETTTQELQLISARAYPYQWIAGLYYLHTNAAERYWQYKFTTGSYSGNTNSLYDTTSYAAYAQGTYDFTEAWGVTAGVRYTEDKKLAGGFDYGSDTPITGGMKRFFRTTWHASLNWKATRRQFYYLSASTGFRSGGFNAGVSPLIPQTFEPESVLAYELGAKTRWDRDKLQVNVAAFYNKYSSLQIVGFDEATTNTYTENGGQARAKGVEVELTATPTERFSILANLSLLDAKWTQLQTVDPITYAGFFYGDGNRMAQSPKTLGSLVLDYSIPLGAGGSLTPRLEERYSSSFYLTDYNTPLGYQPSYWQTDARLTWTDSSGHYTAEAFGNNLTNAAVLSAGEFGGYGAFFASYQPPREYGMQVSYRY